MGKEVPGAIDVNVFGGVRQARGRFKIRAERGITLRDRHGIAGFICRAVPVSLPISPPDL